MRIKIITLVSLLLVFLFGGSCASAPSFNQQLSSIVKPYHFSIAKWESKAILHQIGQWIWDGSDKIDDGVGNVIEYFLLVEQINTLESKIKAINNGSGYGDSASLELELNGLQQQQTALTSVVEEIIKDQIRDTLAEQGIFHPIDKHIRIKVSFPPLTFKLEKLPYLLVVSPRNSIESIREITLQQSINLEEIVDIEAKVDELGVSSLVVEPGGIATYPSLVTSNASLRFTIDAATEEWLHQYLVFKPLGFLYVLDLTGVSRSYEIATINETLASMVSKEIGSIVYEKYYSGYENGAPQNQATGLEFDFNREMREIRRAVDKYLAQGEIERAEEFMEQKQQFLVSMGYYIRKLNQAYFAFHGTYADSPTSISPIGLELKELRDQSASLKEFLYTVAAMTNREDLRQNIK